MTLSALTDLQSPVPTGMPAQRAAWHHLLAALAFGVLAAANVLAFFPALLAAQPRPAQLLRAE